MNQYIRNISELKEFERNTTLYVFQFQNKLIDELGKKQICNKFDEIVFYPNLSKDYYSSTKHDHIFTYLQMQDFAKQCVIVFERMNSQIPVIINNYNKMKRVEMKCQYVNYNLSNYHNCFNEIHLDLTTVDINENNNIFDLMTLLLLKQKSKLTVELSLSNLHMFSDEFLDNLKCKIRIDRNDLSPIKKKNLNVYGYCVYLKESKFYEMSEILPEKFDVYIGTMEPEFEPFILQNALDINELIFDTYECFESIDIVKNKNPNIKIKILNVDIKLIQDVFIANYAVHSLRPLDVSYSRVYINLEQNTQYFKTYHKQIRTMISHFENSHIDNLTVWSHSMFNINPKFTKSCNLKN